MYITDNLSLVYGFFLPVTWFNIRTTISRLYYRQTDALPQLTVQTPVNVRKWFVLISSFFNMMITGGFPFNMSVLFVEFLNAFGKSKAETSLVQSVCTGVFFIGGKVGPWVIWQLYYSCLSTKKQTWCANDVLLMLFTNYIFFSNNLYNFPGLSCRFDYWWAGH